MTGAGLFASLAASGVLKNVGKNVAEGAMSGALGATAWGIGPGDLTFGGTVAGAAIGGLTGGLAGMGSRYGTYRAQVGSSYRVYTVGGGKRMPGHRAEFGFTNKGMYARAQSRNIPQGGARGPVGPWKTNRQAIIPRAGFRTYSEINRGVTRAAGFLGGAWGLGFGNDKFGNSRRRKHMSSLNHYGEMF
tara:strand:+ start:266 stop:832 length:567 start_codon:yes stop_codon:yes gene_type:complete